MTFLMGSTTPLTPSTHCPPQRSPGPWELVSHPGHKQSGLLFNSPTGGQSSEKRGRGPHNFRKLRASEGTCPPRVPSGATNPSFTKEL